MTLQGISQTDLRQIFDYHPDGYLVWKQPTPRTRAQPGMRAGGSPDKDGYPKLTYRGKSYVEHRLIYLWHHGFIPERIDHINRVRSDNRIENLRAVTPKGVYYRHWDGRYQVYATANGKRHVRYANTLRLAEALAHELRNELHGDYACHD